MESYFRNKSVVNLVSKWKYHLIVIAIVAAGVSFAATYLITPMYKSYAVFYPTNIMPLSDESQTEQMLEIINSQDIRNKVFDAFDLYEHYKIDSTAPKAYSKLNAVFEANVSFAKTENEAIQITVYDKDPQVASDMVDSILVFCNSKILFLHRGKSLENLIVSKNTMDQKWMEMDSIIVRQNEIRKEYGILDYKVQVEQYTNALLSGKGSAESIQMLNYIKDYGEEFRLNDSLLYKFANRYASLRTSYNNNFRDVNKKITYTHVITSPYPADVKASPKRLVITIFGVLAALLMGLIIIGLIESKKQNK